MLSRTNSLSNGPVPQQDLQPTGESKTEAAKQVPEAPVDAAKIRADALVPALIADVKAHARGARDIDLEQRFHLMVQDMAQLPPSHELDALYQLFERTAMFLDSEDSDVAADTCQLMRFIFRDTIRPAVAELQFPNEDAGAPWNSRRKDQLLGEIDNLLGNAPLALMLGHVRHAEEYVSAVRARRREEAEMALGNMSDFHGIIADNLYKTNVKMREIAEIYLAQGYKSPAADLVIAVRKYKDAATSEDKNRIYERLVKPAISNGASGADASLAPGGDLSVVAIKTLEHEAMDRVIAELAAIILR